MKDLDKKYNATLLGGKEQLYVPCAKTEKSFEYHCFEYH